MKLKLESPLKKHREIVIALIVGLSLIGYALITRQTKLDTLNKEIEQERINKLNEETQETEKNAAKEIQLSRCLVEADDNYWETWKINCSSDIKKDKDGEITSCSIPSHVAAELRDEKQKEKDRCADIYK